MVPLRGENEFAGELQNEILTPFRGSIPNFLCLPPSPRWGRVESFILQCPCNLCLSDPLNVEHKVLSLSAGYQVNIFQR